MGMGIVEAVAYGNRLETIRTMGNGIVTMLGTVHRAKGTHRAKMQRTLRENLQEYVDAVQRSAEEVV